MYPVGPKGNLMLAMRPVKVIRDLQRVGVEVTHRLGSTFHVEVVADTNHQIIRYGSRDIHSESCGSDHVACRVAEYRISADRDVNGIHHGRAQNISIPQYERLVAGELPGLGSGENILAVKNRGVPEVSDEVTSE